MEKKEKTKGHFSLEGAYSQYVGVLTNAVDGKVVTRFPPEPSGYMHIGHVKAALLNYHYAQIYHGKMILRFDDTNPEKETAEFVEAIKEDIETLGIKYDKLSFTSDYFDHILECGRQLIKKGLAYCDNTPVEKMRDERLASIDSKCRDAPVDKNLEIFEKMIKGEVTDYVLRAKIDMKEKNGCMRDPTLFRHVKAPHFRTGKKYSIYPIYDLSCPIVDHIEGVTHVLRSNEYADRIPQFYWILKALELPPMEIFEFSRLNLQYTLLSKRKLQWFVDTKRVSGWNDPRFPTVRGVMRKGLTVDTLIQFMLEQGPSKKSNLMEWDKLWAINKQNIDPICPRLVAVSIEKASEIKILNGPAEPEVHQVLSNPINADMGFRPLWRSKNVLIEFDDAEAIKVGDKVTLRNWGIMLIKSKEQMPDGSYDLTAEYLPEDKDFNATVKLTWLSKDHNLARADLVEYDHLITTEKVLEEAKVEDIANVNSRFPVPCFVDPCVRLLQKGAFLQFERRAYYKLDSISERDGDLFFEFLLTPDGKKRGIASIQTQTDKKGDIKKKDLDEKIKEKADKQEANSKQQEAGATEQPAEGEKKEGEPKPKKEKKPIPAEYLEQVKAKKEKKGQAKEGPAKKEAEVEKAPAAPLEDKTKGEVQPAVAAAQNE